jgi:hypothetical protein
MIKSLRDFFRRWISQGSSFLATLGWMIQTRWVCRFNAGLDDFILSG